MEARISLVPVWEDVRAVIGNTGGGASQHAPSSDMDALVMLGIVAIAHDVVTATQLVEEIRLAHHAAGRRLH